jgi:hypothetical protein
MPIDFRISGLPPEPFAPLMALSQTELAVRGASRCTADSRPGYPCRVSLRDAEMGEPVILLHYTHHDVRGPYRASGPIYVRVGARPAVLSANEVPEVVRIRLMSLRAYDAMGGLIGADVAQGSGIEGAIREMLADSTVSYLHLHNAKPGCYSCRVDRVVP